MIPLEIDQESLSSIKVNINPITEQINMHHFSKNTCKSKIASQYQLPKIPRRLATLTPKPSKYAIIVDENDEAELDDIFDDTASIATSIDDLDYGIFFFFYTNYFFLVIDIAPNTNSFMNEDKKLLPQIPSAAEGDSQPTNVQTLKKIHPFPGSNFPVKLFY